MGRDAASEPVAALILSALTGGPLHGYAIAEAVTRLAEGPLPLEERELYAALHRLEFQGILGSTWGRGEDHRRAKYYRLRESHAFRPDLILEALALMSLISVSPAADTGSCAGVTAPVVFSGRIALVRVLVNRAPGTFVIDTASDTIVNSDRLHLPVLHALRAATATTSGWAPVEWSMVRLDRFTIGGRQIPKRTALAKSLHEIEAALGQQVDGILGNDVLDQWGSVTLDYKNRTLALDCAHER
jgi:hypothetical protein